ncbi:hypothetical protein TURU_103942 [Turdus rufiventris]|nr:hypothetical protein TURU_103942 [Turdus rufiventris]
MGDPWFLLLPSGPSCPTATPALQVSAGPLLERDTVTLHCRLRQKESVPVVRFYSHGEQHQWWHLRETELSLSPLQLQHSGRKRCMVRVSSRLVPLRDLLEPVIVTVHDWLVLQVLAGAVVEGDTMTLCCRMWQNNLVTSVSFYCKGKELGMLCDGTELSLSPLELNHSGTTAARAG